MKSSNIQPFENFTALDGYHCQTNSLAKIYNYNKQPISEEMLLGLGSGMDFIYWHQKGTPPFIGARGNIKNFYQDIGKRTGVEIVEKTTSSTKRAEKALLEKMNNEEPLMVYGDMGYLPWFDFPEEYHFGGHTFVVCGYDGNQFVLGSDMDQSSTGLKKGFYYPISLEQLSIARNSPYKPFPPKNMYLLFDFKEYHKPTMDDIYSAINQTVVSMLKPPISNLGIRGIRRSANEIVKWIEKFDVSELRRNLFNVYIYTEVGGTGGGSFRYMYSRFLQEAYDISSDKVLFEASKGFNESGKLFTELGLLFKDALSVNDLSERILKGEQLFLEIADIEEEIFKTLT